MQSSIVAPISRGAFVQGRLPSHIATLRAYSYSTNPNFVAALLKTDGENVRIPRGLLQPQRGKSAGTEGLPQQSLGVYSAAAIAFILLMAMSPMLAISSAVKAYRKLSENRICALGGNSSSPK